MKYVIDHGFACPDMLLVLSIQVYNKQFDMLICLVTVWLVILIYVADYVVRNVGIYCGWSH